jgi:hypothetical protein
MEAGYRKRDRRERKTVKGSRVGRQREAGIECREGRQGRKTERGGNEDKGREAG